MRTLLTYIIFAFAGLSCYAQTESENTDTVSAIDTVYIYTNWKSIVNHDPVAAYSGPIVYLNNELETEIFTSDPESQQVVDNQAIAVCVGDTLWLANTNYLNQAFNNKCEWFLNYMPLYFTEKIAFVKFWNSYPSEYLVEVHAVVHHHRVDNQRLFRQGRVDVVLLIVVHHIGGSDECRHITTGFAGQIFINRPKVGIFVISALGTAERLVHIGRAAVVGGDSQRPVVVDAVELLEIACCRIT